MERATGAPELVALIHRAAPDPLLKRLGTGSERLVEKRTEGTRSDACDGGAGYTFEEEEGIVDMSSG